MKLPSDAFEHYFSLGAKRSYQAVAEHYGASKTAVANRAKKEDWQRRIESLEAKAREATERKNVESLEAMNTRHLKAFRVIQGKALEALKAMSLEKAMDAVRAIDVAIKGERLARGEPSERAALSVEETIRREFDRWMVAEDDGEEDENGEHEDGDDDENDEAAQ